MIYEELPRGEGVAITLQIWEKFIFTSNFNLQNQYVATFEKPFQVKWWTFHPTITFYVRHKMLKTGQEKRGTCPNEKLNGAVITIPGVVSI